jgi:methionine biosynthesis protein MetW
MTDIVGLEQDIISSWVEPGAAVLDLGCGEGELLARLVAAKHVRAQGIELDEQAIYKCVGRGLSVLHADIDSSLGDYADRSYDYVILKQSFQQVKQPALVLQEALRIGKKAIVSFPNFTHYAARLQLCLGGVVPITPSLPYEWYNTPNLHFLSIRDFQVFCQRRGIIVERAAYLGRRGRVNAFPNLRGLVGIFVISQGDHRAQTGSQPAGDAGHISATCEIG